ncbi:hypothetical protein ACQJBY_061002 [Aegilops geniculata]
MARANCAVLLWLLVAVSMKLGRRHIAHNAMELMERRLAKDDFPEYYDGKTGRYIGKQSREFQTWLVAGYLVAKMLMDDPSNLRAVSLEDDSHTRAASKSSCSFWDEREHEVLWLFGNSE